MFLLLLPFLISNCSLLVGGWRPKGEVSDAAYSEESWKKLRNSSFEAEEGEEDILPICPPI